MPRQESFGAYRREAPDRALAVNTISGEIEYNAEAVPYVLPVAASDEMDETSG